MFSQIFWFDFTSNLKRKSTWLFFSVFFIATAGYMAIVGGLLGAFQMPSTYFNSALNSASILNDLINRSLLGTIVLITIMAPAVQKDFQYNFHSIYFTKPINKFGYIGGRFMSGFLTALIVLMGALLAIILMSNLSVYEEGRFGAYGLWNYLQGFVFLIIPNTFFIGALFFAIVTYTRNMMSGYIVSVVLLLLVNNAEQLLKNIDNSLLSSLVDPYGNTALNEMTQYWSAHEVNQLPLSFSGYLLYNRIFWMTISSVLFLLTYSRFQFQQTISTFSLFKKKRIGIADGNVTAQIWHLPVVISSFDTALSLKLWVSLTKLHYKNLVKSPYFIIVLLIPTAYILFSYDMGGNAYGKHTIPVTYRMISLILAFARVFCNVIIIFYAGILVWRERDAKMDEIVSATPIKNWVLLLAKITSLIAIYVTLFFYCILVCMAIQLGNGVTMIEPMVYLQVILGYNLITIIIAICFTVCMQIILNNRYLGYFISILIMIILPLAYGGIGIHSRLVLFNSAGPVIPYSDMNGFGHRFFPFVVYKSYWLAFISLLLITANLMLNRSKEYNFKNRLRVAKNSIKKIHVAGYALGLICMIFFGSFIHYNTRVLNKYLTFDQLNAQRANFEKKYNKYNRLPKLKIVDVNIHLAIYPNTRSITMDGAYWIKNKGTLKVDSLFFTCDENFDNYKVQVMNNSLIEVFHDPVNGVKLLKFEQAVMPGDSIQLRFSYQYAPKGFEEENAETAIVENGTYLTSMNLFPGISYHEDFELNDDATRSKFGLKWKGGMKDVEDTAALKVNYVSPDADWIRYECTLSTSMDQIALSPGYLVKRWTENNRNYFHYKLETPTLLYMPFQSARYDLKTSRWKDVDISVYYDEHHPYNVETMISSMKKSLDYYSKNFSDYQFKQLRTLEFPRYTDGAQGFANTISYSEEGDFIATATNLTKEDAVGHCFFTTAHEVAHQWWGHQVVGANVKGCGMIAESFAEYSALRVVEKELGKMALRKCLKFELDSYLKGRAWDQGNNEDPLLYVQGQPYIQYNKAAVILYAISDLIGEQQMNNVLKAYIAKTAFQKPPYTTSVEFENFLKAATPDSLKYAIVDGLEKITLYENRTKDVSFKKLPSGKYKVSIVLEARKFYMDQTGKAAIADMDDYIDIGVFRNGKTGKDPIEIYNKMHKIKSGISTVEIIVNEEPYEAGIDPYIKLIDRNRDDNIRKVTDKRSLKRMDGYESGL
jgi:ABC-2 type transport system permease protein